MSTYDDVHAEAMADYGNERPEPDYRDMILAWADEPLFDFDEARTPMWVYENAEEHPALSHPGRNIIPNTNPCEGATQ